MKRTLLVALALVAPLLLAARSGSLRSVAYPTRTMGTYGELILVTADSAASAPHALAVHRAFARVDSLMSNWTDESEVARINREAADGAVTVHPEVAAVLETAFAVNRASHGCFDVTVEPLVRTWGFLGGQPRVPGREEIDAVLPLVGPGNLDFDAASRTLRFLAPGVRIDLGGIAKGYGVDAAARVLAERGVENALINISGNMVAMGAPPARDTWVIGIRDPRDRIPYVARISISGSAIATSGKYEQFVSANGRTYGHIIDPHTGRPAEGLLSVTVVAPSATEADAWGTAFFVLGPERSRELAREQKELGLVLIQPGETVDTLWVEDQVEPDFRLEAAARAFLVVKRF